MVEDIITIEKDNGIKYYHIKHSFWGVGVCETFLFEKGVYVSSGALKSSGFTISMINKYSYILKEYKLGKYRLLPQPLIDEETIEKWKEKRKDLLKISKNTEEKKKKDEEEEKRLGMQRKTGIFLLDKYYENVSFFCEEFPFFYDKGCIFWFWSKEESKWEMKDEVDVMNQIDDKLGLYGQTVTSNHKNNYLEAFRRVGRKNIPIEPSKNWIQFKDKIIDIKTKEVFKATPDYFFCNPIPWELGENSDTPTIDKLFSEWVGEEYIQTLYEIIAYSCITDYPIHLIFCLVGSGRNGKSRFLKLLSNFVGKDNISSTELDLILDSRFETIKLYKKLVCLLGETNFGIMNKTSLLKKLTGQDLVGFEKKNKTPFDDYNYAKVIISSNSLPTSEDTSEGFYRRWLIVDFPNMFQEGKDILETIPAEEYSSLAKKVSEIAPMVLETGKISCMGTIEQRRDKYIMASNPLPFFIKNYCIEDPEGYIRYSEFYTTYCKFLLRNKKRVVSRKEFSKLLNIEGFENRKTSKDGVINFYIENIKLLPDLPDFREFPLSSPICESKSEFREIEEIEEKIHQKCYYCGESPTSIWHKGKPICNNCNSTLKIHVEEVR